MHPTEGKATNGKQTALDEDSPPNPPYEGGEDTKYDFARIGSADSTVSLSKPRSPAVRAMPTLGSLLRS